MHKSEIGLIKCQNIKLKLYVISNGNINSKTSNKARPTIDIRHAYYQRLGRKKQRSPGSSDGSENKGTKNGQQIITGKLSRPN